MGSGAFHPAPGQAVQTEPFLGVRHPLTEAGTAQGIPHSLNRLLAKEVLKQSFTWIIAVTGSTVVHCAILELRGSNGPKLTMTIHQSAQYINRDGNIILIPEDVKNYMIRFFVREMNVAISERGYQDVILDFSTCVRVYPSFMLPALALCSRYRSEGVDIVLRTPTDIKLNNLFQNTNWAYYLDPDGFEPSNVTFDQHVPARQFSTPDEQYAAVDSAMKATLSSLSGLTRKGLQVLEWSLSEITDNVLNHAEALGGGFVQVTTYAANHRVEYVVADAGIGIPASLEIGDHEEALRHAIREGTTRDSNSNAGNGLFGSFSVATASEGSFTIESGSAKLSHYDGKVHFDRDRPMFPGTVVVAAINYDRKDLLEQALSFGGKSHDPAFDYIERKFESETSDEMTFVLKNEAKSFGSRTAGKSVKQQISNLLAMRPGTKLNIDLSDVTIVSSSFADEVFGPFVQRARPLAVYGIC